MSIKVRKHESYRQFCRRLFLRVKSELGSELCAANGVLRGRLLRASHSK